MLYRVLIIILIVSSFETLYFLKVESTPVCRFQNYLIQFLPHLGIVRVCGWGEHLRFEALGNL